MKKETIFISHSSKDKEAMNYFQKLLMEKTNNIFSIFLSSDGQSIPFGTNWIHKIEDGLNNAKVMFVFVTSHSVQSSWIYFEAGYAYSKGIKVIPIGIGIDINKMRPPLNLLQGFNINSFESMNNCIKIINDEFDTTFKEDMVAKDYNRFIALMDDNKIINEVSNIVDHIETTISSYIKGNNEQKIEINADNALDKCKEIIEKNGYVYNCTKNSLLTTGVKIDKTNEDKIEILINIDEFVNIFGTIKEMIKENYQDKETHYINIILNSKFDFIVDEIKVSSIIKKSKDIKFFDGSTTRYKYKDVDFILTLVMTNYPRSLEKHKRFAMIFSQKTQVSTIIELIKLLKEIGIIYLKSENE